MQDGCTERSRAVTPSVLASDLTRRSSNIKRSLQALECPALQSKSVAALPDGAALAVSPAT
jgi:hypothetical protein